MFDNFHNIILNYKERQKHNKIALIIEVKYDYSDY